MPYKEREIEKLFYSIGEVAEMFQVNTSLIRFWEKEFNMLKPAKSNKGTRLYTSSDIDKFKLIYHLVKEKGYTLDGARNELKENKKELQSEQQLIKTLQQAKALLLELREKLNA